MIVVRVELWPGGDPAKSKQIGLMVASNDCTGGKEHGNYNVFLFKPHTKEPRPEAVEASGRVEGHKRSLSVYHLVLRGLRACGVTFLKKVQDDDEVFK